LDTVKHELTNIYTINYHVHPVQVKKL